MPWAAIVFGWPAATLSLVLGVTGLLFKRWMWIAGGMVVGSPFLLYLSLAPRFGFVAALVGASYAGAVVAMYRERDRLAWALFAPMPTLFVYVALVVVASNAS